MFPPFFPWGERSQLHYINFSEGPKQLSNQFLVVMLNSERFLTLPFFLVLFPHCSFLFLEFTFLKYPLKKYFDGELSVFGKRQYGM